MVCGLHVKVAVSRFGSDEGVTLNGSARSSTREFPRWNASLRASCVTFLGDRGMKRPLSVEKNRADGGRGVEKGGIPLAEEFQPLFVRSVEKVFDDGRFYVVRDSRGYR